MKNKQIYTDKLIHYLSNPENNFPKRKDYPRILGICRVTLYKFLSPDELTDIEVEASENRRRCSSRQREHVLRALYTRALGYSHPETRVNVIDGKIVQTKIRRHYPPDPVAAREFLDRTEGKVGGSLKVDVGVTVVDLIRGLPLEDRERLREIIQGKLEDGNGRRLIA